MLVWVLKFSPTIIIYSIKTQFVSLITWVSKTMEQSYWICKICDDMSHKSCPLELSNSHLHRSQAWPQGIFFLLCSKMSHNICIRRIHSKLKLVFLCNCGMVVADLRCLKMIEIFLSAFFSVERVLISRTMVLRSQTLPSFTSCRVKISVML